MHRFFLRENASRARLKEAHAARENRREIVKAESSGRLSRRELLKYGLFTRRLHWRDSSFRGRLARYIAAPDRMLSVGDPMAKALFESYKQLRMPNLSLSEAEVRDAMAYLASVEARPRR